MSCLTTLHGQKPILGCQTVGSQAAQNDLAPGLNLDPTGKFTELPMPQPLPRPHTHLIFVVKKAAYVTAYILSAADYLLRPLRR